MHIHILGICGTFMAGIAALAKASGHKVTGCDQYVYPPMSDQLHDLGIEVIEGYGVEQLQIAPDCYVIGNVVSRAKLSNDRPRYPLLEAILNAGVNYTSGPQWLAEHILPGHHVLAVAGTHGKTSTASMLAWILEKNGFNPGFLIGGMPQNFNVSARLGRSPHREKSSYFVIEADEYDTAFFDKRSKFLHYRPKTLVLNNLEFDHADIFDNLEAIERQFHHLLRTIPSQGRIVCNADDQNLGQLLNKGYWSELRFFTQTAGAKETPNTYSATGSEQLFNISYAGQKMAQVEWNLIGQHNQYNALAAISAAHHINISPAMAAQALQHYQGVRRRMEIRGSVEGITIYDDFAHHPSAVETTLIGLRKKIGNTNRILAVLEPRSNTMKLGVMAKRLPTALNSADLIFAYSPQLDWNIAETLKDLGERAQTFNALPDLINAIVAKSQTGDHIVCMSNGSFGNIHDELLKRLAVH